MESRWGWVDESKTVVFVSVREDWSHQDLIDYATDFWPQMAQQPHTVHVIVDLRRNNFLPMHPVVKILWFAKRRPKNAGRVVFVVGHVLVLAIVRSIASAVQKLYPQFHLSGVLTFEEAVQMLSAERTDETVEVRASSQTEADSQSPSGSPQ